MVQAVRAIYEHGHLRLLDPVTLAEGEQVSVTIQSERERLRAALGDLVVEAPSPASADIDADALMRLIEEDLREAGYPSVSDAIIEERREGL
jgi:predicted DNA-binding antitoxin AbrB/MazE fold protein